MGIAEGMGETESPSRVRPRRMQKSENLLLYYGVDLALENSNPLTTHIVFGWKYSIEWFLKYFLNCKLTMKKAMSDIPSSILSCILASGLEIGTWMQSFPISMY